jgi:hypothetical protein
VEEAVVVEVQEDRKRVRVRGVEEAVVVVVVEVEAQEDRKLVRGPGEEEAVVVAALEVRILSSEDRTVLSRRLARIVTSPDPVRSTTAAVSVETNKMVASR